MDEITKQEIKKVKKYLNSAWYWKKKQKVLEDNIEVLRSRAEKMTATYSDAPVFGGYEDHRQSVIEKMVEKERKYEEAVKNCDDKIEEIQNFVDGLDGKDSYQERIVLEYHYIYFMGWLDIACKLHYHLRTVFKIHNRALHNLLEVHKKIINNGGKPLF